MKMLGLHNRQPRRMDSFAVAERLERPAGPKLNQLFTAEGPVERRQRDPVKHPLMALERPPLSRVRRAEVPKVGQGTRTAV
jgi:hypothetical protein